MIDRRTFLAGTGAVLLAGPLAAEAQQEKKMPRVAFIFANATEAGLKTPQTNRQARAFAEGMRELGWLDGQNITIELRTADGQPERYTALAKEVVGLHVDVIVVDSTPVTLMVAPVSRTIPIVIAGGSEEPLIRADLIKSLARPGGSVTGLLSSAGTENAKALQLLKEAAPRISRVGMLFSPPFRLNTPYEEAARALKLTLLPVEVASPEGLEKAFATFRQARVDAIFVGGGGFFATHRQRIIEFAAGERVPTASWFRTFPESGGLMSYGTDWYYMARRAAAYVDKILKGAKPADLPMEQPTKFELIINLKTAKALGLTIPPSLLGRADEVIQ